jgi:hypothetical protein
MLCRKWSVSVAAFARCSLSVRRGTIITCNCDRWRDCKKTCTPLTALPLPKRATPLAALPLPKRATPLTALPLPKRATPLTALPLPKRATPLTALPLHSFSNVTWRRAAPSSKAATCSAGRVRQGRRALPRRQKPPSSRLPSPRKTHCPQGGVCAYCG